MSNKVPSLVQPSSASVKQATISRNALDARSAILKPRRLPDGTRAFSPFVSLGETARHGTAESGPHFSILSPQIGARRSAGREFLYPRANLT